jgi:hypothetical protein
MAPISGHLLILHPLSFHSFSIAVGLWSFFSDYPLSSIGFTTSSTILAPLLYELQSIQARNTYLIFSETRHKALA